MKRPVPQMTGTDVPGDEPSERSVAFGFEDVANEDVHWPSVRARLAEVGATAVTLAVGRADWLAFPWASASKWESSAVAGTGRDFVAEALAELDGLAATLVVDALAPRAISLDPGIAGRTADGESSPDFLSVSALDGGYFGTHLEAMCREVARRYRPERIALTELMFDDATFSRDDLAHFVRHTGRPGFPLAKNGEIDVNHPDIHRWRCESLVRLLGRVSGQVAEFDVRVDMDVRVPWGNPDGDRADSGHDYALLLESVDRIVVWNYFALADADPSYGADLTRSLLRRFGDRFVISTGLWSREDGVVSPEDMTTSLRAVAAAGGRSVSVIPTSLMAEEHWEALAELWAGAP
ncbi:hypothetical protein [Corynebacterium comes]|uniref:Uncharacterized protein n=1 Tax=Corynebacterium comes TaxID=2675218 RepID=A0A6B8VK93_9CORY|nr:hypothetical protein [Corynebacterium comes]QGU03489.1 hypothetical protein CETAM_00980 [Corynebacterium comes]